MKGYIFVRVKCSGRENLILIRLYYDLTKMKSNTKDLLDSSKRKTCSGQYDAYQSFWQWYRETVAGIN